MGQKIKSLQLATARVYFTLFVLFVVTLLGQTGAEKSLMVHSIYFRTWMLELEMISIPT